MAVEFRLLGDVTALVDGRPVPIGYAQLRSVLAILLVEANHPVPVDRLVDRVWLDRPLPARPRAALQHNIAVLRKALAGVPEVTIGWRAIGYQLDVDPETVDLHRFRDLITEARTAPDDDRAAAAYQQALGLWRGEPFMGLATGWLAGIRTTLIQQRDAARLDLTDIRLRRGEHPALLEELRDWTEHDPLDERLAGQYLLALYRNGRQAEALEHYERTRKRLAEQLGADPSPPLRLLHRQILDGDAALGERKAVPPKVIPRQLSAMPRLFTGRDAELARLTKALDEPGSTISIIGGAGGIGKTWLALHWAHQQLDRFPDGQLQADLLGFDPVEEPATPGPVVRGFLDALGIDPAAVPAGADAQAALYRSVVAGKHLLIVLDNARDSAQVEPLLPGGSSCTVLITSRQRLTALVTRHGARTIDLDALAGDEAHDLLTAHLGADRVAAEPVAAAELLAHCAGLPLAIGIVSARAAAHPHFPLAALAAELREQPVRLDSLDGGDPATSLRSVLASSYRALPPRARTVFSLLGLPPGADIGVPAAASLTALSLVDTRKVLRDLDNAYLVKEHQPGRYRMHDLIRGYATELAPADSPAPRRLVDYYLHTSYAAGRTLDATRHLVPPEPAAAGVHRQEFPDENAALTWLTEEHTNLLACQQLAAHHGWHTAVWQLAWNLDTFHWRRGRLHSALTMWRAAKAAADALSDPHAQTVVHQRLGNVCAPLGEHADALHHLQRALELSNRTGERTLQAHTRHILAWLHEEMDDIPEALNHAIEAARLFNTVLERNLEANALNTVGWYHALLGQFAEARTRCEAGLALLRDFSDPQTEATILDTLGYVAHQTGEHAQARDHYQRALTMFQDLGFAYEEANTLEHLGETLTALGRLDDATTAWRHALDLYQAQHRTPQADRIRHLLASR